MKYILRLTGAQHETLRAHLFPGDGLEAVAVASCGRLKHLDRTVFCVHKIALIPHRDVRRSAIRAEWPTRYADDAIQDAAARGRAVLKLHSHPGGLAAFSPVDDSCDRSFFASVSTFVEDGFPHSSVVMLPDGRLFGRAVTANGQFVPFAAVTTVGTNVTFWHDCQDEAVPAFAQRHAQVFGDATANVLRRMRVAVVGCSGTGSPLIEQLVRLGVGELVLVDPDVVEEKNLNRIYMSTMEDARRRRLKVDVISEAICRIGLGTSVECHASDLGIPEVVRAVAACDFVFGCMDSVAGRDLLNRLATFYSLPYIDLGVQLTSLQGGGVDQITGAVHYLQPGKSSLRSRGVYDSEDVRAELLLRDDPEEFARRRAEKYIRGVQVERPAVISVNSMTASLAATELLARIHRFRYDTDDEYASLRITLHEPSVFRESENSLEVCPVLARHVGRGDTVPLLDRPELSE